MDSRFNKNLIFESKVRRDICILNFKSNKNGLKNYIRNQSQCNDRIRQP